MNVDRPIFTVSIRPALISSYFRGQFVRNMSPTVIGTIGSRYQISGWRRQTYGSTHIINQDWVEERVYLDYTTPIQPNVQTSSYSPTTSDTGPNPPLLEMNMVSAGVVTLANNHPVGSKIEVVQSGAGQITFSAASGASVVNVDGLTKTKGLNAIVRARVISNSSGTSAVWVLDGAMA